MTDKKPLVVLIAVCVAMVLIGGVATALYRRGTFRAGPSNAEIETAINNIYDIDSYFTCKAFHAAIDITSPFYERSVSIVDRSISISKVVPPPPNDPLYSQYHPDIEYIATVTLHITYRETRDSGETFSDAVTLDISDEFHLVRGTQRRWEARIVTRCEIPYA